MQKGKNCGFLQVFYAYFFIFIIHILFLLAGLRHSEVKLFKLLQIINTIQYIICLWLEFIDY